MAHGLQFYIFGLRKRLFWWGGKFAVHLCNAGWTEVACRGDCQKYAGVLYKGAGLPAKPVLRCFVLRREQCQRYRDLSGDLLLRCLLFGDGGVLRVYESLHNNRYLCHVLRAGPGRVPQLAGDFVQLRGERHDR